MACSPSVVSILYPALTWPKAATGPRKHSTQTYTNGLQTPPNALLARSPGTSAGQPTTPDGCQIPLQHGPHRMRAKPRISANVPARVTGPTLVFSETRRPTPPAPSEQQPPTDKHFSIDWHCMDCRPAAGAKLLPRAGGWEQRDSSL